MGAYLGASEGALRDPQAMVAAINNTLPETL